MLTYNRPFYIGRAIDSICRQSFPDWELIVVQDGANAETSAIVLEQGSSDPRIRYFYRKAVGSIAEASNFGLSQANGEYIAILDDDDLWSTPDKLARQIEFLDRHPEYVACGGGYILIDQAGRSRGVFMKPEDDADIRSAALLANPIANSTSMFRRLVGGMPVLYDVSMRGYADWDFWLTMGKLGKLYNFPEVFARYTLWEGGGSFRQQKVNAASGVRIVYKHHRGYGRFAPAILLSALQYGYACLPPSVRRLSYQQLSRLKKVLARTATSKEMPARTSGEYSGGAR